MPHSVARAPIWGQHCISSYLVSAGGREGDRWGNPARPDAAATTLLCRGTVRLLCTVFQGVLQGVAGCPTPDAAARALRAGNDTTRVPSAVAEK